MVLALEAKGTEVSGTLAMPEHFEMSGEGVVSKIGGTVLSEPVKGTPGEVGLPFGVTKDGEKAEFVMKVIDAEHAELRFANGTEWMAPLKFTRAKDGEKPEVAKDWSVHYPEEIAAIQARLKAMETEDQALRFAPQVSLKAMDEMSKRHRPELERIHQAYGWPKWSQFGVEAANNFWLLVQHQGPEVQRAWIGEMEALAKQGEASSQSYAMLFDRVQVGLGRKALYGTQNKCVAGKATMDPVEDPERLAARRLEMHMPPVEAEMRMLEEFCKRAVP